MPFLIRQRLPKGFAWDIAPNGQLGGIVRVTEEDVISPIMVRAGDSGSVRDPFKAVDLNALADEYGEELYDVTKDPEQYRKQLAAVVYTPYRTGSDSDLQNVLNDAGWDDVLVVKNNQQQDPREFMGLTVQMVAGGEDAVAGNDEAYMGSSGYEVLVNGPLKTKGGLEVAYEIGDNQDYWGYVDFICGAVTYDGNGNILTMDPIDVVDETVFKRLVLRTKPMHNWIVLVVNFVPSIYIAQTGDPEDPIIAETGDPEDPVYAQPGA
jgi:hypothetical protein